MARSREWGLYAPWRSTGSSRRTDTGFRHRPDSYHIIIAAGCALSFFNLGAWGALYAVSPEIYPTALRGTGSGGAAAFGRLASIIAPLAVPWLLAAGGSGPWPTRSWPG